MYKTYENKLTISDKLVQLQNALKLEERNENQSRKDAIGYGKSNFKEMKQLEKEIDENREKLKENILGSKEEKQAAMRNNKFYQRAYHQIPTKEAVDNIKQRVFTMKKEYDKLSYERSKLESTYSNLKFQLQEYQNLEKLLPTSFDKQELVNKIQNMSMKQNAARIVNDAYERLFNMLDKEALRFDKTIKNMETDRVTQAKCILRATETGQEASQKLADLQDSYKMEERKLRQLMKKMDKISKNLKSELESVTAEYRDFVQTESLINLSDSEDEDCRESVLPGKDKQQLIDFQNQIETLKVFTEVLTSDDIFPRIKQQYERRNLLLDMVKQQEMLELKLLDQYNELFTLRENLEHTIIPSTESFKMEQERLASKTDQMIKEKKNAEEVRQNIGKYVSDIRMGLINLKRKLDRVDRLSRYEAELIRLENPCVSESYEQPQSPEKDPLNILEHVNMKILMMVNRFKLIDAPLNNVQYLKGKRNLEQQIIETNATERRVDVYDYAMHEIFQETVTVEDPSVPTRAEIKKQSARIVRLLGSEE